MNLRHRLDDTRTWPFATFFVFLQYVFSKKSIVGYHDAYLSIWVYNVIDKFTDRLLQSFVAL